MLLSSSAKADDPGAAGLAAEIMRSNGDGLGVLDAPLSRGMTGQKLVRGIS
jgi:hypothetical protein